jgi:hypothetical protein
MLFDAHTRSFAALGGVARRGIYDNMKTAVDKVKKGKGRVVNARFAVMCAHYLFDADFCNVASGWKKGVVEKNMQDSRRRIWLDAQKIQWGSFAELHEAFQNHLSRQKCQVAAGAVTFPSTPDGAYRVAQFGRFNFFVKCLQSRNRPPPPPIFRDWLCLAILEMKCLQFLEQYRCQRYCPPATERERQG